MKSPSSAKERGEAAIGVIGCGDVAQAVHLPLLTKMNGVRIAAIADRDSRRLEEAARLAPQAVTHADDAELLAAREVEAVVICLPTALHAAAAVAALQAGKHVYLEKPVATNAADARRLLEVWRQSGAVGMVGLNYRFHELYQQLREYVGSGRLGRVVAARSVFTTAAGKIPSWKQSGQGSGALLDLASHEIDLLRFVLDEEVAEVFADSRSMHSEADTVALQLKMESGAVAQVVVALAAVEEARFEVIGDRDKVAVDRYRSTKVALSGPHVEGLGKRLGRVLASASGVGYLLRRMRAPWGQPSFEAALEHFVGAVRGEHPASPDLADGWRSLAVALAAAESARDRQVKEPCYAATAEPAAAELGDGE